MHFRNRDCFTAAAGAEHGGYLTAQSTPSQQPVGWEVGNVINPVGKIKLFKMQLPGLRVAGKLRAISGGKLLWYGG